MMGCLSKLIIVDNLGCPKCKRNSAEFLEKKNYPQIKRICWNSFNIDRVVQSDYYRRDAERRGGEWERCIEKGGGAAAFVFMECREQSLSFRVRKSILFIVVFFKYWSGWTGSVRFGSIGFRFWKLKPNRTGIFLWFFNRLIRLFSVRFFWFFFV